MNLVHRLVAGRATPWALPFTGPAAALYGAASFVRRALYDAGVMPVRCAPAPCKVISVGGLEAGGTGKTPTAAYLLRLLLTWGLRPGLLSRGFGRQSRGLVVRHRGAWLAPTQLGDEPAMLVRSGLDVPIAACADRFLGAKALAALGCDTLVLDDGFAHRALARHLNIVTLRGESPFGDGRLLPRGDLREWPSALGRADVLWLNYRRHAPPAQPPAALQQRFGDKLIVLAHVVPGPICDLEGQPQHVRGMPVVVAAGIARPADFLEHLQATGADICDVVLFADHHCFGKPDVEHLQARVRACGAQALVVTAKDAVKLVSLHYPENLWACDTQVVLHGGAEAFLARLKSLVSLPI